MKKVNITASQVQNYIVLDYIVSNSKGGADSSGKKFSRNCSWVKTVKRHVEQNADVKISLIECQRLVNSWI